MVLRTVSFAGTLLLLFSVHFVFAQDEYSIRELKAGKFVDDSSYIYELPFAPGKKVWLVQGYDSRGNFKQLATRFRTTRGIKYLRPAKFYRRPEKPERHNN
jgi:hypothetical protein